MCEMTSCELCRSFWVQGRLVTSLIIFFFFFFFFFFVNSNFLFLEARAPDIFRCTYLG